MNWFLVMNQLIDVAWGSELKLPDSQKTARDFLQRSPLWLQIAFFDLSNRFASFADQQLTNFFRPVVVFELRDGCLQDSWF